MIDITKDMNGQVEIVLHSGGDPKETIQSSTGADGEVKQPATITINAGEGKQVSVGADGEVIQPATITINAGDFNQASTGADGEMIQPVITINAGEIKISNGRQGDGSNRPLRQRRFGPRSGYRFWLRRIFIGKDEVQVKRERETHPWIHFLKGELGRHTAEFIGTFFLVFFIAGVQINQSRNLDDQIGNVDKGLAAGFILIGLIFCFGHVSGAHFNPCVTLGFFLRGAFGFYETISYIIIQFAGSVVAAAVLYGLFGNVGPGLGTTTPQHHVDHTSALVIEILVTFILITVILTTAQNVQIIGSTSGIAVGTTFGALELFAWNFTGGSANPWRTIGPTIISGVGWNTYWIYIVGPLVGTFMAVVAQRVMINGMSHFSTADGKGHNMNSEHHDRKIRKLN